MRVAAIYDVHGNLPALEAVLEAARQARATEYLLGGDVVPGPMPRETIDRLLALDLPIRCIRGNGEAAVLARMAGLDSDAVPERAREAVRWTASQLGPEHGRVLMSWPLTQVLAVPGLGEVLFCHATPRNETEIFTRSTPESRLIPVFGGLHVSLVVCGHTHMQFDRTIGGVRVVNAGSVGMPFGDPGAHWLLLGPGVEFRHTSYDLGAAARRVARTGYPGAADFAAHHILDPPSERKMLEALSKAELA